MTLEKLLNILCEKGWKPRGEKAVSNSYWVEGKSICWNRGGKASIRELVSKDSGLWQFVCENGMIGDGKLKHNWVSQVERGLDVDCKRKVYPINYEYRLIESALCDEDKLEKILLDNIKIDE